MRARAQSATQTGLALDELRSASPIRIAPGGRERPMIALHGHSLRPDPSGAVYWPAHDTLLVADLHLEKGSCAATRGWHLPPYDTAATLGRLEDVVARYRPGSVVALGDSFHDSDGPARLSDGHLARLHALQRGRDWCWITGNHDPAIPARIGGQVAAAVDLGGVRLVHAPTPRPGHAEIAGHLHPVAKLSRNGATLRRKCFAGDGTRLILPAFGAFTGGLNILDRAFAHLFAEASVIAWMLGARDVYPVSRAHLRGD